MPSSDVYDREPAMSEPGVPNPTGAGVIRTSMYEAPKHTLAGAIFDLSPLCNDSTHDRAVTEHRFLMIIRATLGRSRTTTAQGHNQGSTDFHYSGRVAARAPAP